MPQDSLRSAVYRSFVTCDDPKGVAEYNTNRKSKKIKNASTSHREERRKERESSKEELQKLSCFQMMEVSRGAERLNAVVIDSLSNRHSIDRPPEKQIATELLRGALDLQESLVMLGKLQEASKYIATSTKKQKEKRPLGCRGDEGLDFEKPRISADRAPKDCYDELRDVIRESFARQNLLPHACAKERISEVDGRNSKFCVDFPSSSSSQSSLIHSHSSGCSSSSIRHETVQGPNLIAKLMGLEEVPSKGVNAARFKQMEKERIPYRISPLLDIDLPRPKKPQFMVQKVVPEKRTLEEIIETIQFNGILGGKSVDRSNDWKCYSNASFLRRDLAVDGPPIVIMKPLRGRGDRNEELHDGQINEGERIKSRQMVRKVSGLKAKEPIQKHVKEGRNLGRVGVRPVKKTLDSQEMLSTEKTNHLKPLVVQIQKKEVVSGKIDKIPKVAPNTRKPAEAKDFKPQRSDKTQDLAKLTAVKHSRNIRENNLSKNQTARAKVAAPDKSMKPTSPSPTAQKKNQQKGESNSKPSSALVKNTRSDGHFAISIESNIEESAVKNNEQEQSTEEVAKASYISGAESSESIATSPDDASGPITKHDLNPTEDDKCIPSVDSDEIKGYKSIINTRHLLLSSVSFLNHVEELFDIGTHDSTVYQEASFPDTEVVHGSLVLDCSKEILERKSRCSNRMRDHLSQHLLRKPKCHLSMEQLVEDICDDIEVLQNYSKSSDGVVLVDCIYPMLDRDLRWNEEVTGAWDSGWRQGCTTEAVDEVMHDVEELVLSEIVAAVIIEIMY